MKFLINILLIVLVAISCISFIGEQDQDNSSELLFFVNSSVIDTELKRRQIEDIYFGDKTVWSSNKVIVACYLEGGSETGEVFFRKFINTSTDKFNRHWVKLIFSGYSQAPKNFDNPEQIIEYVNGAKGAIGFISKKDKSLLKSNCKIITIL